MPVSGNTKSIVQTQYNERGQRNAALDQVLLALSQKTEKASRQRITRRRLRRRQRQLQELLLHLHRLR